MSLSFVALVRSIEAGFNLSKNRNGKVPTRTQIPDGCINEVPTNTKGSEGMRIPLHQRRHQRRVFHVRARRTELPEVDTT
jgi:hypothetical protein